MKSIAFVVALLMSSVALSQPTQPPMMPSNDARPPGGPADDPASAPKPTISDSAPGAPTAMPPHRLNVVPSVSPDIDCAKAIGSTPGSNASEASSQTAPDDAPMSAEAKATGCYIEEPDKSAVDSKQPPKQP